jgi:hypothetical protein
MAEFFNQDFWRSFFGSILGGLVLVSAMSATAVAAYKVFWNTSLRFGRTVGVWVMVTAFLFLGLVALKLNIARPIVAYGDPTVISQLADLKQAVKYLSNEQDRLLWRPLTQGQKDTISSTMGKLGQRRALIMRSNTADCGQLADSFAATVQQSGWRLLGPPYEPSDLSGNGILIIGNNNDLAVDQLKDTISKELKVTVQREPLLRSA